MAEQNITFRSALHGFNRSDVITYLSELTAQHAAQLEEKDEELLAVKNENARMKQELASMKLLAGKESAPEAEPASEPEELPEPEAIPAPDFVLEPEAIAKVLPEAEPEPNVDLHEQELEAYRRAERCEREARIRAGKVYGEASAVVEKAKAQLADQESQLTEMNEALTDDIAALQAVMAHIRAHLSETQSYMQEMEQNIRSIDN